MKGQRKTSNGSAAVGLRLILSLGLREEQNSEFYLQWGWKRAEKEIEECSSKILQIHLSH